MKRRVTYELMAAFWPTADKDPSSMAPMVEFAGVWRDKPTMVFARTLQRTGWNSTIERAVDEITALAPQPGEDLALGGADLAAEVMRDDVIDGYRICVHSCLSAAVRRSGRQRPRSTCDSSRPGPSTASSCCITNAAADGG